MSNKHCKHCEGEILDRRKNKTFCGESCREEYIETLTEKTCTKCGETRLVSEFGKASETYDRLSNQCKECVRRNWESWYYKGDEAKIANAKANRKHYAKTTTAEKLHAAKLRRYSLTPDAYSELVERSQGLCEICREVPFEVIDHCHDSGAVRGLLCAHCNRSLGGFKDSVDSLKNAIDYLTK